MKRKVLGITMALLATLSCVKEKEHELQPEQGEERFAEYDPVVRFGLDTYMGGAGDNEPLTKTTYAGDDKTIVLDKVRYERINWNVDPSDTDNPQDVVRILSETDFTKNDKKTVDYKAVRIPGFTNESDTREDRADTEPFTSGDELYWSQSKDARYFYGFYPSPFGDNAHSSASSFALVAGGHTAKIVDAEIVANQSNYYIDPSKETGIGEFGTRGTREYMPDMRNAYMYAAAVLPGAEAGYRKVPLRFKPLFTAIKVIVSARDGDEAKDHSPYDPSKEKDYPAAKYRLTKLELRTDINQNDIYLRGDPDINKTLSGKFSASFEAGTPGSDGAATTGDFTLLGTPTETGNRLTIDIRPEDRVCLNDDTFKFTFLALPIDQQFMTVDYTFEYLLDDSLDPNVPANWSDLSKVKTFHRTLALQDRTKIFENKVDSWYKLPATHKLYIRSNVPAIEYVFKVEAQSFFPRNLEQTVTGHEYSQVPGTTDQWVVEDFYSVVSYRDSSGVLQPLKWQVTGYSESGADGTFSLGNKPDWLAMCGETIGTYNPDADVAWYYDPANPADLNFGNAPNGISPASDADIWAAAPWGFGSRMDENSRVTTIDPSSGKQVYGYTRFNYDHTYVFYNAGAKNNGAYNPGASNTFNDFNDLVGGRNWKKHVSANYCDQDGKYYYTEYDENGNKLPDDIAKTPYAFDLSSHDIYGDVYPGFKNGDIVTTANCYVVSAPGWYRFPTVYGNGYVNGAPNPRAYTGVGGKDLLGSFKDHNDNDITQPWVSGGTGPAGLISPGTDGVELVWEDADDLVDAHLFAADASMDAERGNKQKPFYWVDNDPDSPNNGNGYIYFYVNQISFSNAVLAAKAGGTTVWSWHIWCVPDPEKNLKTVAIEPSKYNFHEDPSDASTRKPFPFDSVYGTTDVWEKLDLGQGKKDKSTSSPRKIYVEFKQYWRGKAIHDADARRGRVVVCFAQSGLKDESGIKDTPAYQWGRKDPLQVKDQKRENANISCSGNTLGTAIRNPNILYWGSAQQSWHGETSRWDNLWNSNVDYCPQTFETFTGKSYDARNGYMDWYNSADVPADAKVLTHPDNPVGRKDTPVCKTIYDPCPPGYMVPNLFAFTAFNNRGLKQMRADGKHLAWNYNMTEANQIIEEDGVKFRYYAGFYYAYQSDGGPVESVNDDVVFNGAAPSIGGTSSLIQIRNFKRQTGYYRRKKDDNKVVLFYGRGRVNGSSASNTVSDDKFGMYWLAEPASFESDWKTPGRWSYGSAFQFQQHTAAEAMRAYPVTGGNFAADAYYATYPAEESVVWNSADRAQAKWQREHALYVRPMLEKDPPGMFTGSNMGNPNIGVNPF